MIAAGMTSTSEAVRSWPIATIKTADCVTGDTCGQGGMVSVFLFIIPEMYRLICSCLILRKQSILCLNTGHLIMSRRIEVLSIGWRKQWLHLILQIPVTALTIPPVECCTFTFSRSAAGSIYVLWKGYNSEYKNILIDLIVYE